MNSMGTRQVQRLQRRGSHKPDERTAADHRQLAWRRDRLQGMATGLGMLVTVTLIFWIFPASIPAI